MRAPARLQAPFTKIKRPDLPLTAWSDRFKVNHPVVPMIAHGDPRYSYGRRGRQSVQECSRQLDNDCGPMSSVGKRRNQCDLRHSGFEVHLFA